MIIALDAMGGDVAPQNPVEGAVEASRQYGFKVLLVGVEDRLKAELDKHDTSGTDIEIVHASEHILMTDSTLDAMRSKRDSSIRICARLVKEGDANALVSAGHTGAAMAISKIICGSLKGVKRPALALTVPTVALHPTVFLDVGANVTCTSSNLVQFAIMGNTFAKDLLHFDNPRIGVLSNGEEATKGNKVVKKTIERLNKANINFVGAVEGDDIFNGECEVVVTDGFTGNAVLKAAESIAENTFKILKREIYKSNIAKFGALLLKNSFKRLKKKFDYAEYGGAPLLGINGVSIVCHGRSSPQAIKNALRITKEFCDNDANQHIQKGISDLYKENILEK